jgi:hypothetical protein
MKRIEDVRFEFIDKENASSVNETIPFAKML